MHAYTHARTTVDKPGKILNICSRKNQTSLLRKIKSFSLILFVSLAEIYRWRWCEYVFNGMRDKMCITIFTFDVSFCLVLAVSIFILLKQVW